MEKMKSKRVTVSLPAEMAADFRLKSELTGLSVSRLIFLKLRTRKPIIIVGRDVLLHLDRLCQMVAEVKERGCLDEETLTYLRQETRLMKTLLLDDTEDANFKCHVKKR